METRATLPIHGSAYACVTDQMFFRDPWGVPKSDIWLSGDDLKTPFPYAKKLLHYNGTKWAAVTAAGGSLWATGPNALWVINDTKMQRFDGKAWTSSAMPAQASVRDSH